MFTLVAIGILVVFVLSTSWLAGGMVPEKDIERIERRAKYEKWVIPVAFVSAVVVFVMLALGAFPF